MSVSTYAKGYIYISPYSESDTMYMHSYRWC